MTEPKTILVVEDDVDIREAVAMVLESESYSVEDASQGREALELIGQLGLPDLILLDMRMPVMDGWQFATELRTRYGLRTPPIVVMTAASDSRSRAAEINASACLGKPFELDSLRSVVRSFLGP